MAKNRRRILLFVLATAAVLCCAGAAAVRGVRRVTLRHQQWINCREAASRYGLTTVRYLPAGGVEYSGKAGSFSFVPGKRTFTVNGLRVDPSFAVLASYGLHYMNSIDFDAMLAPVFEPQNTLAPHRLVTVTIDAGHGGRDKGASGRFSHEKVIVLRLAYRVAAILRACGYKVHMTREIDRYVGLEERVNAHRQQRTDLFVSIHINSAKDRRVSGIECFSLTPMGAFSSGQSTGKVTPLPGNARDTNNFRLAYHIQKALLRRTGAADRGLKRARFAVLRNIEAPGVLVEVGFISNPAEERLLNTPAYQEKLARGIVEGIVSYRQILPR